ncbi:MAG: hypothetical protein LBK27_04035 [Treponema sp.]|jgi:hypothetical protein|nr:hypothetical protein [Treponema sp.]
MIQTQITLPDTIMDGIKREAEKLGVTPNVFMRIQLCTLFSIYARNDEAKTYIVRLKNWQEVETYVQTKGLVMQSFLSNAANSEMKKHPLERDKNA